MFSACRGGKKQHQRWWKQTQRWYCFDAKVPCPTNCAFCSGFRTQIEGTFWTLGKQPGPRWSSRWCCCLVIKWRSSNTEGRQSSIKKLQVTLLLTIQLQSYLKICWIQRVFSKGTYQARPCCSHGRTLLQRFTGHVVYENLMSFLIVANSLVLGLQALSLSWDCLWASQIWSNFSL